MTRQEAFQLMYKDRIPYFDLIESQNHTAYGVDIEYKNGKYCIFVNSERGWPNDSSRQYFDNESDALEALVALNQQELNRLSDFYSEQSQQKKKDNLKGLGFVLLMMIVPIIVFLIL